MVVLSTYSEGTYNDGVYNIEGFNPNTVGLVLDGQGQYLGRAEVSSSAFGSYNEGTYSDGIYNFPQGLGIGNTWTMGFWAKPKSNKEHMTFFAMGGKVGENAVQIFSTPISTESTIHGKRPSELRVVIKDSDGTTIRHSGWPDWFQTDVWTHTFLTWNGVDLTAAVSGIATPTGVSFVNVSGTMGDKDGRRVFYGSAVAGQFATFSGILGHFGMWDEILDPLEIGTVVSGGFDIDLTSVSGAYNSEANLQHYWKPGEDLSNIGKDFTTSGTALDLTKQRNITTSNVTFDSP